MTELKMIVTGCVLMVIGIIVLCCSCWFLGWLVSMLP